MSSEKQLTKGQKLVEIARCLKDPIYGMEKYLRTEDRTQGGEVPFRLFPRQKVLVQGFIDHRHNIVMKPRQAGISTTTAGYSAILTALSNPKQKHKILIAANKQETAKEFLKKIKDFTRQLPDWMDIYRPPNGKDWFSPEKNSDSHYRLNNGSEVKAVASSKDALRGYTPSLIIVDEAAFIEGSRGEEFYEAAQPSLSTGGRSILISCVTDDTFVLTPDGVKEVSDFIDYEKVGGYVRENYQVYGYGGFRESNLFHNNGFVDTKIVTTKYTKLEGSNNHKLYAYSDKFGRFDWYQLDELSEGDYLPIVYGQDVWGNNDGCEDFNPETNNKLKNTFNPDKITEEISYFLGLFLAEGSVYKKYDKGNHVGTSVTISCGDDVSHVFNDLGINFSYDGEFHYTTGSKQLGEFLEYIGFDLTLKAKNKVIPKRIFELSRNNVISFIRGFMDGDGYSRKDNGRVGLNLGSKRLVEQLRVLFMNLGILTEYQEKLTPKTKRVNVESMGYRLNMNNYNSKLFYDIIGFGFERKQLKRENLGNYRNNDPRDVIPCGTKIIRENYEKGGKGLKYYKDLGCDISHITKKNSKNNHVSRGLLLKFMDIIGDSNEMISSNITWVKVKSIENSQNNTYDFSLPNDDEDFWCHSVIYNGILGHQTPNGYDPLYHKTYKMAELGKNNYNITDMKWYEDPRYNGQNDGSGLTWLMKDDKGDVTEEIHDPYSGIGEKSKVPKSTWKEMVSKGYEPTSKWFEDMCADLNHNPRSIAQELLCVTGDSLVKVRDKVTGEIKEMRMDSLYNEF